MPAKAAQGCDLTPADAVVIQFPSRDPQGDTGSAPDDQWLEDDESFWDEMMQKGVGEIFCDLLMLCMGIALLSILVVVSVACWWASVTLVLMTKALI